MILHHLCGVQPVTFTTPAIHIAHALNEQRVSSIIHACLLHGLLHSVCVFSTSSSSPGRTAS